MNKISTHNEFLSQPKETQAQFWLESAHFQLFFYESEEARAALARAEELLGVSIAQTGKMGKRTR